MKSGEIEKMVKEFRRWFSDLDVTRTDKELLKLYGGGKDYGLNFFIAYCAGYEAGKKEEEEEASELNGAIALISDSIVKLKNSRWDTHEDWEERMGVGQKK
ncbi:MAG: hypothetical protein LBP76_06620 [Treponema sp.]|nr:hypothetical protein [Treponema sp.]